MINKRISLILIILVSFSSVLGAEDRRTIPLDMYLIIDGSESFQSVKNDAVVWLSGQVVDRILMEGDKVTIWTAGEKAEIIYSGEITSGGDEIGQIKDLLLAVDTGGKDADFSGALIELQPKFLQTPENRLPYSMLVTSSAGGLGGTLSGSSQGILRWSRSKKYERWQVLTFAPGLGRMVNQAATAYMAYVSQQ